MILEACVESLNEAIVAEKLGAQRIELCDNLSVDGTTPSAGTIEIAHEVLSIPIMVLIRPRGGDYVYSEDEIRIMEKDILFCKSIGVTGVVFGALNPDHTIDLALMKRMIDLARPMKITFHKAIDQTSDPIAALNSIMELGVDYVLTSGGAKTAFEGQQNINEMVRLSNGKLKVIAAGDITKSNLQYHMTNIRTDEFHGKQILGSLKV
jgi:copper homeostasis protein